MDPVLNGYVVLGAVTVAGILLFVAAMAVRRLLAPRVPSGAKLTTYESGVDPTPGGWAQFHIRYLAYALLYVVFAVDSVFLFPWALVLHDQSLNRASLAEVGIFVAVVLVALVHVARRRMLTWGEDQEEVVGDGD